MSITHKRFSWVSLMSVLPEKAHRLLCVCVGTGMLVLTGCGGQEGDKGDATATGDEPKTKIRLQTDWYPQPEHGGFYQALAKGYYEEVGLDVTLLPGGSNAMTMHKVLRGEVEFSMHRADHIIQRVAEGIPLTMLFATFQNDSQALMYHASNPLADVRQLADRKVVAVPGLSWITYVEKRFGIRLRIQPHDFGLVSFLGDPNVVQQCLITNEPYFAEQAGVAVGVLRLSETGFNPYHVVYARKDYALNHPKVVEAFRQASIRGWLDYLLNDPTPAHELIAARNAFMTEGQMQYARQMLIEEEIVTGNSEKGDATGLLRKERLSAVATTLYELGIIRRVPDTSEYLERKK